jgi:hypothetical protein
MSKQDNIELWLQRQLRFLSKDELSPAFFSASAIAEVQDGTIERWQLAVDMIYRCIISGLIGVLTPKYRDDHDAFFHAIRTLSPYGESGINLWHGADLFSTDELVEIVEKHFPAADPYDPSVNPAFIQELKDIFGQHGVPWSDATPLLVVANGQSASA